MRALGGDVFIIRMQSECAFYNYSLLVSLEFAGAQLFFWLYSTNFDIVRLTGDIARMPDRTEPVHNRTAAAVDGSIGRRDQLVTGCCLQLVSSAPCVRRAPDVAVGWSVDQSGGGLTERSIDPSPKGGVT